MFGNEFQHASVLQGKTAVCSADGHKQYAVIMHALLHAVGEGQFWISLVKSIQICHDILWLSWSFNACSTGADLSKGGQQQ